MVAKGRLEGVVAPGVGNEGLVTIAIASRTWTIFDVAASQTRMVLSSEADTRYLPSGDKATDRAVLLWY